MFEDSENHCGVLLEALARHLTTHLMIRIAAKLITTL